MAVGRRPVALSRGKQTNQQVFSDTKVLPGAQSCHFSSYVNWFNQKYCLSPWNPCFSYIVRPLQLLQWYYLNISRKMLEVSIQLQAIPWYHQGIWIFYVDICIKARCSSYQYSFCRKKKVFSPNYWLKACSTVFCLVLAALFHCSSCWNFSVAEWEEFTECVREKVCLDLSRLPLRKKIYEK